MSRNLSIWLLPSTTSPEYHAFAKVIDYLAQKHGKTSFSPHATLAMLPADFPLQIVEDVINEMKQEWFSRRLEFEKVFTTWVGIAIQGRHDTLGGLGEAEGTTVGALQQKFHDRLQEEVQKRRTAGTIPADTPDVKNIVPWFPHISLAYTESGQEESVKDIEGKGWYTRNTSRDGVIEIGGFQGYKIGAIHFAYCGGLKPEKWTIFEQIEEEKVNVE